jgi:nucleotide-binding universal stress UspA family protein
MYRTILVALDGSGGAHAALRRAVLLASEGVRLLHAVAIEDHLPRYAATVSEMQEARDERDAFFAQVMEEAKSVAAEQQVELRVEILAGHAAQTTVQRAQRIGADLIVLGHSGHSSVWGNLLGTTADKVAHHAPCDVLIVR